ncbi:BRO-N domain-containing protein [Brucella anthropi]|uniref:BRO-N domain-containing protein n=1 Tax=Brucella anthropi TaxID=529 RepID=UPI00124F1D4A|nr:Bro-N domain-containing protein [Brucella anthropi]KAB2779414.1 Bro-N domain-containing protein [Brucella anthropi]
MRADIDVQNFEFEGNGIRSIIQNDEPWFVLSDVCRVLDIRNARDASARLDDDEKGVANTDTLGGAQDMTIINESGLYSLILTSRKPAAKRFKKWVTSEVLPTLRRTGVYIMDGRDEDLPSLADGKVFGMKVAKVNAAARLISVANAIYGPEAARALWESETGLPKVAHRSVTALAGTSADDPNGCLRHLLRSAAENGRTIGEMLRLALHDSVAARLLPRFGMLADPHIHKGYLAIASDHPFLAAVFSQTQWAAEWKIAMMQLAGSKSARLRISGESNPTPVVLVPKRAVLSVLASYH